MELVEARLQFGDSVLDAIRIGHEQVVELVGVGLEVVVLGRSLPPAATAVNGHDTIVWLFGLGSLAGIYFARRSLREIRESEGAVGGRVLALAGLVIGIIGLASTALVVQFFLAAN